MKCDKEERIIKYLVILFAIIRIFIQMGLPIWGIGQSNVDDLLMIDYAENIFETGWLGDYNYLTLNKVPGFSIFLVICRAMNLPYNMAIAGLYSIASMLFFVVINKMVNNYKLSFLSYIYILFSPVLFDLSVQRVYRISIIPPFVLFVVVSYLAIYLEHNSIKKSIPWLIIASVFYPFFNISREDTIWLKCFVFGATVLILFLIVLEEKDRGKMYLIKKMLIFLLPVFCTFILDNTIKIINYKNYGIYETNDFNTTGYADMGKSLLKIEGEQKEHIWITHDVIEKVYEVSPTFAKLRPALEEEYKGGYQLGRVLGDDGEIEAGYIMWAIRSAAQKEGIYVNAANADAFYKQVNSEIEEAFKQGKLKQNDAIILSNLARPFRWRDLKGIMNSLGNRYVDILSYRKIKAIAQQSSEPIGNLRKIEAISNSLLIYPEKVEYCIDGWMFSKESEDTIRMDITDKNGNVICNVDFEESFDVYNHFESSGNLYSNAKKCRFYIRLENCNEADAENYEYNIYLNNELECNGKVTEIKNINNERILYEIDKQSIETTKDDSYYYANRTVKVANFIINIYKNTAWIIVIITIFGGVFILFRNFSNFAQKKICEFSVVFVLFGLLLTMFANILIVAINYYSAHNEATSYHYLGGVYPVWHTFVVLVMVCLYQYLIKKENVIKIQGVKDEINNPNTML